MLTTQALQSALCWPTQSCQDKIMSRLQYWHQMSMGYSSLHLIYLLNKLHCVCMHACIRMCVCVRMCVGVCVCVCVWVCMCACACVCSNCQCIADSYLKLRTFQQLKEISTCEYKSGWIFTHNIQVRVTKVCILLISFHFTKTGKFFCGHTTVSA